MLTVHCTHCDYKVEVARQDQIPAECPRCFEILPSNPEIDRSDRIPERITLQHVATGKEISVLPAESTLLGRKHLGAALFNELLNDRGEPVISRIHCEIVFRDGIFQMADRNSTNGVFLGEEKRPCGNAFQPLPPDDYLFLGRERFLIQIHYQSSPASTETENPKQPASTRYRCSEMTCKHETDAYSDICTICGTMHSLVPI